MKDKITLIDRYKVSPTYEKQITAVALLLDKPREGMIIAGNVTGAVGHGQEVEILEKKQDNKALWCYVTCEVEHEGKAYPQKGWVKRQFLENEGASYFEEVNK
jgi:hypothetical protein